MMLIAQGGTIFLSAIVNFIFYEKKSYQQPKILSISLNKIFSLIKKLTSCSELSCETKNYVKKNDY